MTDLEITKLCAQAMGLQYFSGTKYVSLVHPEGNSDSYDPLQDDAQAMALVKRWYVVISHAGEKWLVTRGQILPDEWVANENLNRAICECVAKMMKEVIREANSR